MKKIEKVLLVLFCLSIIGRLIYFPGAIVLTTIVVLSLSVSYIFFGWFIFKEKETRQHNLLFSILSGIFLSQSLIWIVFKINVWPPDVTRLQSLNLAFIIILSFIALSLRVKGEKKAYYGLMLQRFVFIGLLSILFLLVPIRTLINTMYRNNPEEARLLILTHEHPENEEYQREYRKYWQQRDSR
jgi:uncharacterized membrane protein